MRHQDCENPELAAMASYRKGCRCPDCKAANAEKARKYRKTESGKASIRRTDQREERKDKQRAYKQSEKSKATQKSWRKSEAGKASNKKHNQSEKGKASSKRYRQSEKGKAAAAKQRAKPEHKEYMRDYRSTDEYKRKIEEAKKTDVGFLRRKYYDIVKRCKPEGKYGKRGIFNDFESVEHFLEWALAHPTYAHGKEIHRVDRFKNYSPENCIFVTHEEHKALTAEERGWAK